MLYNKNYQKREIDTKLPALIIAFGVFFVLAVTLIITTVSIWDKSVDGATTISGTVATVNNNNGRFDLTLKNDASVYYISKSFYAEHKAELNAVRVGDSITLSVFVEGDLSPILNFEINGASFDTSASIVDGWEENKKISLIAGVISSALALAAAPFLIKHIVEKRRAKRSKSAPRLTPLM